MATNDVLLELRTGVNLRLRPGVRLLLRRTAIGPPHCVVARDSFSVAAVAGQAFAGVVESFDHMSGAAPAAQGGCHD
jgi:hypothetical protein